MLLLCSAAQESSAPSVSNEQLQAIMQQVQSKTAGRKNPALLVADILTELQAVGVVGNIDASAIAAISSLAKEPSPRPPAPPVPATAPKVVRTTMTGSKPAIKPAAPVPNMSDLKNEILVRDIYAVVPSQLNTDLLTLL